MLIISSMGGSGSTFVRDALKRKGYEVCARPDAGRQKLNQTMLSTWGIRTQKFFHFNPIENITAENLFKETYTRLKTLETKGRKIALLLLEWGAMGFLQNLDERPVYIIRNPLFAFNSYSSGTAFNRDKGRRIKYAGGKDQNDPVWVDAFFGNFSLWLPNAENALKAVQRNKGFVVRYFKFEQDWKTVQEALNVPDITGNFKCMNNIDLVHKHLSRETISYIKEKTDKIWNEILALP